MHTGRGRLRRRSFRRAIHRRLGGRGSNEMAIQTFPYRDSTWHQNDATSERWLVTLEKTGTGNVRARLAIVDFGSAAAIAIGSEQSLTIGFAQEWLNWMDSRKTEADIERHERQIWWTRFAAIAASIAASSASFGWLWTIFMKKP